MHHSKYSSPKSEKKSLPHVVVKLYHFLFSVEHIFFLFYSLNQWGEMLFGSQCSLKYLIQVLTKVTK